MIIEAIHWNVSPEIFHIGSLSVRWYGLLFAASFYFGYILFTRFFKLENVPIEVLDRLTIYMAVGTVVGARLGHCFFYEPQDYLSNPIEILKIWHGGLASHGAAIGILLALLIFSLKEKRSYLWIVDRIVIVVALSGFFIRLGNLMNSEIYGTQTDLPWGFIFVRENEYLPKHPTQIYEALAYLAIFGLLLWIYYRGKGKPKEGILFSLFLILVFTARFFIEFIKNEQVKIEQDMVLKIGQKLSIPFVLAGIILLVYSLYRKPVEPTPVSKKK
jgi:phosphatidylglycerol---prolipoprotein diacylglyceryl transferase